MIRILHGDCIEQLRALKEEGVKVNCCVTSPPYFGLRNYGVDGQIGLEETPKAYTEKMVEVFGCVWDILEDTGTTWLNLGDSYAAQRGGTAMPAETLSGGENGKGDEYAHRGHGTKHAHRNASAIGLKHKDLIGIPWRVAFALQESGWFLRSEIIWAKPNGMPGSQEDRCTSSHEHIFLLAKSERYWSDFDAIKTPPRESTLIRLAQNIQDQAGSHRANGGTKINGPMKAVKSDKQRGHGRVHAGFNERWDKMSREEQQSSPAMMRDVWFVPPASYKEAHFAVMPEEIARRCILAGCPEGGTVLDPFFGAGTTGLVADRLGRQTIGIELNPQYIDMARRRISNDAPMFVEFA